MNRSGLSGAIGGSRRRAALRRRGRQQRPPRLATCQQSTSGALVHAAILQESRAVPRGVRLSRKFHPVPARPASTCGGERHRDVAAPLERRRIEPRHRLAQAPRRCAAGGAAATPAPPPAGDSCRSASSRTSSARSSASSGGADLDRGHRAQPAGEVGQLHRPARRRRAGGEQHRQTRLARGVQQMQQRRLVRGRIGVVERDAGGRQFRQPGQRLRRATARRRCARPRCAADGSCRGPPRPRAPADGSASLPCAATKRRRPRWTARRRNRPRRNAARERSAEAVDRWRAP